MQLIFILSTLTFNVKIVGITPIKLIGVYDQSHLKFLVTVVSR